MSEVFTPMNETKTERLRFNAADVKVLDGNLNRRGLGCHATVRIKGKIYKVYGKSCGLPNCQCDAYIREVKITPEEHAAFGQIASDIRLQDEAA